MARIRSVKPEFWTHDDVLKCSRDARLLFVGMWNFCDANGVHPAKATTLRCEVFPGDDDVTASMVEAWVGELMAAGLIEAFEVGGKRYWYLPGFKRNQVITNEKPRHPAPSDKDLRQKVHEQSPTAPVAVHEQSVTVQEQVQDQEEVNDTPNGVSCPEADKPPAVPEPAQPQKPVIELTQWEFPTVGGTESWTLPRSKLDEYRESFPGVDLDSELRKARQWCRDKPKNRKTPKGMTAFLNSWLSKAQNESSRNGHPQPARNGYGRSRRSDELFDPGVVYQGDPEPAETGF